MGKFLARVTLEGGIGALKTEVDGQAMCYDECQCLREYGI